MRKYLIGKIINTHGVRGELLIKPLTDFNRFIKDKEIFTLEPVIKLKIKQVRHHNKGLIVSFYDYDNINLVINLKGLSLYTNEKPNLLEDEYHFSQLIGLEVYNQDNVLRGIIKEVVEVPQGHLLRIKVEETTKLIPFNKRFIKEVKDNHLIINEIEGLL
ncbi:MAG: ribosome maturation factor RimM [Acholeplasmatales bacterium]